MSKPDLEKPRSRYTYYISVMIVICHDTVLFKRLMIIIETGVNTPSTKAVRQSAEVRSPRTHSRSI